MIIKISNNPKTTLWKLNSSLLNNPQLKADTGKEIEYYFNENNNGEVPFPTVWENIFYFIFAKKKKKAERQKLSSLQTKLKELQKDH